MTQFTVDIAVGALDQLIQHSLTGCDQAGRLAAQLLDTLSECAEVDRETRCLCGKMCEKLETGHA